VGELYGYRSPAELAMANTDVLADVDGDRRNGHVAADCCAGHGLTVEVGVAIAIGVSCRCRSRS